MHRGNSATHLVVELGVEPGSFVRPTLRLKLHGRGPRAEADAARRLPRSTREDANRDLQPP
jgi:hypothetical protein